MLTDLKYAVRTLWKAPAFTLIAIATLALGIGASTAIFSVLDAVLLRPLPYPNQDRLVEVNELNEAGRAMPFTEPNLDDLAARNRSFEAVASYARSSEAVAGGKEPARTDVAGISADFFRVLGVRPALGRLISAETLREGNEVAVVSYGFWKRTLEGRTNLEGTSLRFTNHDFAVIGVLPPETEFPAGVDVWYPFRAIYPPFESRTGHNFRAIARLRPAVSFAQAGNEVAAIGRALKSQYGTQTDAASFGLLAFRERFVRDIRSVLFVLCGAAGVLLAIACSNVANLLLVRASSRRKEVALRAALGASRWRLTRQFLVEALLLALAAGAIGTLLSTWSVQLIVGLYHGDLPRVGEIGVSTSVLLFALAISVLLALVLGVVPVLHASRRQLQNDLQEAGRGGSTGARHTRVRNVLIVAQVALTLMLLVGAGLLGRSLQRLLEVDPGFRADSVVALTTLLPDPRAEIANHGNAEGELRALAQFNHRLLERLRSLPGVTSAGGTSALPMSGNGANGTFIEEHGGKPAGTEQELARQFDALSPSERLRDADYRAVSAGYFEVMDIPLLRGRLFEERDGPDAPQVALVSQALAKRYWPNENAIGKQIQFGNMDSDLRLLTVVGIVGDVRDNGLDREPRPTIYLNYLQRPATTSEFSFVVRGQSDVFSLTSAMRREARALNPQMPIKIETVRQIVAASFDNRRFSMIMLGVFAGAALALAMVGLYGIMSYITSQRTTEIGIRMALGAQRSDMLRMILRQSLFLAGAGMTAGILLSLGATRLLGSFLFGVGATDFFTYAIVLCLLGGAVLLASFVPARRAMQVDPMVALRYE
ncbi:MAG: ABC transporter permease [Chthoniobacterales bacterium]|nr:ABC transporter permease [Chthoniobacterales bacterium]